MSCVEEVVLALVLVREPAHATCLAQQSKALATPSQHLVHIALVRHIEHEPIAAEVKDAMQSHRQLDDAQVRTQVPAGLLHTAQQELTRLFTELR